MTRPEASVDEALRGRVTFSFAPPMDVAQGALLSGGDSSSDGSVDSASSASAAGSVVPLLPQHSATTALALVCWPLWPSVGTWLCFPPRPQAAAISTSHSTTPPAFELGPSLLQTSCPLTEPRVSLFSDWAGQECYREIGHMIHCFASGCRFHVCLACNNRFYLASKQVHRWMYTRFDDWDPPDVPAVPVPASLPGPSVSLSHDTPQPSTADEVRQQAEEEAANARNAQAVAAQRDEAERAMLQRLRRQRETQLEQQSQQNGHTVADATAHPLDPVLSASNDGDCYNDEGVYLGPTNALGAGARFNALVRPM